MTNKQTHRQTRVKQYNSFPSKPWQYQTYATQSKMSGNMIKLQRCIHLPIRGHSYIFKMADCLIFNPVNAFKTTDLKKKIEKKNKNSRYIHTRYQNHRKVKGINTNVISPMSSSKYWMNLYLMMFFISFDYIDSFLPPLHYSIFLSLQQNKNILYSIIFILCE